MTDGEEEPPFQLHLFPVTEQHSGTDKVQTRAHEIRLFGMFFTLNIIVL